MPWKFNDLSLGSSSAVEAAREGAGGLLLTLAVTAAERRELEEMCAEAGALEEYRAGLGTRVVKDTTPDGRNTILVQANADTDGDDLVDGGWFAVEDVQDDWGQSSTIARLQLSLKRIAGVGEATGAVNASTEYINHEF